MLAHMTDNTHSRILAVAGRVYAEAGYHGATTRRIAQEADVNEVTLFRHFGSKDALIRAALEKADKEGRPQLDFDAAEPYAELHRWAEAVFAHFYTHRDLIRRIMADMVQFPEIAPRFCEDNNHEYYQLTLFLERLAEQGQLTPGPGRAIEAAVGMLLGAIFLNTMWRDVTPEVPSPDESVKLYLGSMLRALGAPAPVVARFDTHGVARAALANAAPRLNDR